MFSDRLYGLVIELGQDAVQAIMVESPHRDDLSWSHAATTNPECDDDVVPDLISEDDQAVTLLGHPSETDDEYDGLPSTFAKACRKADEKQRRKPVDPTTAKARQLLEDDVSLERAWREMNNPPNVPIVTSATLEAAEYLHDLGDLESFKRWFDRHSAAERAAIFRHLDGRKKGRGK